MRRTILTTAAVVAAVVGLPGVASAGEDPVYVVPADVTRVESPAPCPGPDIAPFCGWERDGGSVEIGPGVADPASGDDHLLLSTPAGNDKAYLFSYEFTGTQLGGITTLGYRSYVPPSSTANPIQAPALNIEVDRNGGALEAGDYAVLTWEPYYAGEPLQRGEWLQRTPSSSQGGWWSTRNWAGELGFTNYRADWADVQAGLQNATVLGIGINQGGGNPGLAGQVDLLTVGDTTYDFETELPYPTAKEQCKKGGWADFTAPGFRNQGQCVSWVARQSGDA